MNNPPTEHIDRECLMPDCLDVHVSKSTLCREHMRAFRVWLRELTSDALRQEARDRRAGILVPRKNTSAAWDWNVQRVRPAEFLGQIDVSNRDEYERDDWAAAVREVDASTGDDTRWGGTVGAGLEYGFAPNWSAAIEYDRLFMQDRTSTFNAPSGIFFSNERIRQDVDLVTVRVNYRWGGPVVAKY